MLEEKIKRAILPAVLGIGMGLGGLTGCGTVPYTPKETVLYTQKEGIWYDCETSEDYPILHPCYDEVKEYRAKKAVVRVASSSSSSSDDVPSRPERGWKNGGWDHDCDTSRGGHWVCPR